MLVSSETTERAARRARLLPLVALGVLLIAFAFPAAASATHPPAPRVVPPIGKVYDHLSVDWWQYILAQPAATNPLNDPTGARCATGQHGLVFFLVGGFGDARIQRDDCTVPFGRLLFFPLVNAIDVHVPGDGLDTPEAVWEDLQTTLGFRVDSVFASVDGVPVQNLRPGRFRACAGPAAGCAPAFSIALPAGNLFGIDPGTYSPAVADGAYLLLAPLAPGRHTIRFGGTGNLGAPFSQDITYRLRVAQR